ncbi:hypothetical protein MANES_08G086133v8 [Manihot esculenta]|uniref:Uncharacterized protein n=1 Tax=Manihot esculenta TaxID=3983 RepID=A0ACB7H9V1_MANES|nr:hypothetical protein MANES_08G086133v8 [Manihot esculenta]
MCFHMNHMMLMFMCFMSFFRSRMRGSRRSARLTGAPPENEGMDARPLALPRTMSCRSSREGTSRDPRRSFDVSRRGTVQGGMSAGVRGLEEDEQRRDGSLGMSMSEEGMEESQGGAQASGFGYPPQYQPFPQGPGYPMGGTSDYSNFNPYPSFMPYPSFYPPYPQYPMFPPSPFYPNPANPNPGNAAPPPPPAEPVAPEIQTLKPSSSVGSKVKMTDYLKLDAPKFKTGDDPFEYLKTVKMITDELGANDSRAIQMAGFTLKCKKAREWFKNYVDPRLESLSWEQFANEFAGWAFPDNSRELKVVEFEQLRQTEDMSVNEYTDKFLELLQYVGQAYDTDQKKARRYTMRLHPRYSSMILAAERESFHTIVDAAQKMEASAIIEGSVKQTVAQSLGSKTPGRGKLDSSSLSATASGSKKWGKSKQRKNKFWNRLKFGLGLGGGSSSGSDGSECLSCGKPHKGVCRFGTTTCFRCGQEGHMARECPRAAFMAPSQ